MKKLIRIFLITVFITNMLMVIVVSENAFKATAVEYKISINGTERNFSSPIVNIDGRTYLSVRELSALLGYNVEWDEENKSVNLDSSEVYTYNSTEGLLENGRKFMFNGMDKKNVNFQNYKIDFDLTVETDYKIKIIEKTPKDVAEAYQSIWGTNGDPKTAMILVVEYDPIIDSWIIYEDRFNPPNIIVGGMDIMVIHRVSGVVKSYSTTWR